MQTMTQLVKFDILYVVSRSKKKLLQKFIKKRPGLVWFTKNYDNLSEKVILESVLNYGTWNEFLETEKILGVGMMAKLFWEMKNQHRINLRPEVVNYFSKYFKIYA